MASRNFPDVNSAVKMQFILRIQSMKLQNYCFTNKDASMNDILMRETLRRYII